MNPTPQTIESFVNALPRHEAGMVLAHNPHKGMYEDVKKYLEFNGQEYRDRFPTPQDVQAAMRENELWELTWWPDTPVGSCTVYASTLERLIQFLHENPDDAPAIEKPAPL